MKYVIEIDDKKLCEYDKDTHTYFPRLWKAKGFNSLVFDENGLEKLTPLDKELEEAYQKGYNEAWASVGECEDRVAKQAYQKGYDEGYQKGFEVGQHEATTLEYQQGLDDAWEAARKIAQEWEENTETEHRIVIDNSIRITLDSMTASEAIAKIKAYEEQQKADEIKVGDEVTYTFIDGAVIPPFVVFAIKNDGEKRRYEGYRLTDGKWVGGLLDYKKTGRHFPQIKELLEVLKGEQQKSCCNCKYDVRNVFDYPCSHCSSQSKWEQKGGAE